MARKKEAVKKKKEKGQARQAVKRTIGWKSIPLLLKIIFLISVLNVLFFLPFLFKQWVLFFGFTLFQPFSTMLRLLLNVIAPIILVFSIWKGCKWGWKYGIAYYIFFTVNSVIGMISFIARLSLSVSKILIGTLLSQFLMTTVLDIIFLIIILKKKDYFNA